MRTQIKKNDDGTWNLYVNGECLVLEETYSVVAGIEYSLNNPDMRMDSEADEIAQSIFARE
jgi:hypothetical protein